jgi:NADPH:quinone reductase-like Zn-dependent oxidoreductase
MKAIVCMKYGPPEVLQLKEVEKPAPKDDEVLIKIRATAVTASDIFIRSSQVPIRIFIPMRLMLGVTKPRKSIIGLVLAGEIESTGKKVKRFKSGDQVYGLTGFDLGAYAEYKCMKVTDSTHGCLAIKLKDACRKALAPRGKYVSIDDGNLMLDCKRLPLINELVEAGHIKPVIDRSYPLEQIVEAHRYVGQGHKKGGVAIEVI